MTFKEVGRLTLTTFLKFYQHYKDTWDAEMRLRNANVTYAEAEARSFKAETSWF